MVFKVFGRFFLKTTFMGHHKTDMVSSIGRYCPIRIKRSHLSMLLEKGSCRALNSFLTNSIVKFVLYPRRGKKVLRLFPTPTLVPSSTDMCPRLRLGHAPSFAPVSDTFLYYLDGSFSPMCCSTPVNTIQRRHWN